ncbi:MAG: sigma-70 family RNA polymerase sigma factor, partial [candidate division NC10 bacterium]|nr:sigma-70 family RNA polymerase sigma factor [candidate division NC10 bacterium]
MRAMAVQPGEESAAGGLDLQHIWDEFQPRVRRYLTRLVGAREADDLTQETFLRISQALEGFRSESALS